MAFYHHHDVNIVVITQVFTSGEKYTVLKSHSSLPVIHKVGNFGIFVLFKFENKLDIEINPFNFNSKHYDKCKFSLKLIGLLTVSNLFPLEVVQKYQHCQLCVLRENSI